MNSRGSVFASTDVVAIIVITVVLLGTGILFSSGAIDSNTLILVFFGVFSVMLAKYAVPLFLQGIVQHYFEKGKTSYWGEVVKEIRESPRKHDFSYDLMIPESYMPQHSISMPAYDLYLFEINRDDLAAYVGERFDFTNFQYPQITIVFRPSKGVIEFTFRGTLEATVRFIEEHKEAFLKESKQFVLPREIREISYGSGSLEVSNNPTEK